MVLPIDLKLQDEVAHTRTSLSNSILLLGTLLQKQGLYDPDETQSYLDNPLNSRMSPIINLLKDILNQEQSNLQLVRSEIHDQSVIVEELSLTLGKPAECYLISEFDQDASQPYKVLRRINCIVGQLKKEILERQDKMTISCQQIVEISSKLNLEPRLFDLSDINQNVSSSKYYPILRELERLTLLKKNRINSFNTALSWIYYKWYNLSLEPEEKDEFDLILTKVFSKKPAETLPQSNLAFHGIRFPFETSLYNWYSTCDVNTEMSLSEEALGSLFRKSVVGNQQHEELIEKKKSHEVLKRLYRIADFDLKEQPSILDSKGNINFKKLEAEINRTTKYIEDNKNMLLELHMARIEKIWECCSVSQDLIDEYRQNVKNSELTVELLGMIVDDYERLKYQFDNAPDIFSKIRKRKFIIDTLREFESNHQSKDRFKGSSLRLIKEEKFRKTEYPKLVVLENGLLEPIKMFEKKFKTQFLFEGGRFLHILNSSIERRSGNLEIIGVKDSMSEESFSNRIKIPKPSRAPSALGKNRETPSQLANRTSQSRPPSSIRTLRSPSSLPPSNINSPKTPVHPSSNGPSQQKPVARLTRASSSLHTSRSLLSPLDQRAASTLKNYALSSQRSSDVTSPMFNNSSNLSRSSRQSHKFSLSTDSSHRGAGSPICSSTSLNFNGNDPSHRKLSSGSSSSSNASSPGNPKTAPLNQLPNGHFYNSPDDLRASLDLDAQEKRASGPKTGKTVPFIQTSAKPMIRVSSQPNPTKTTSGMISKSRVPIPAKTTSGMVSNGKPHIPTKTSSGTISNGKLPIPASTLPSRKLQEALTSTPLKNKTGIASSLTKGKDIGLVQPGLKTSSKIRSPVSPNI